METQLLVKPWTCCSRLLAELPWGDPGLSDGVQPLILAPGLDAKSRETLMTLVSSRPSVASIPVLELLIDTEQHGSGQDI